MSHSRSHQLFDDWQLEFVLHWKADSHSTIFFGFSNNASVKAVMVCVLQIPLLSYSEKRSATKNYVYWLVIETGEFSLQIRKIK